MCGLISRFSILLYWPICLFLCRHYTVLITIIQFEGSPVLFFLFEIVWLSRVFWGSIQILGSFVLFLWNVQLDFDRDCTESVFCFEYCRQFNNICPSKRMKCFSIYIGLLQYLSLITCSFQYPFQYSCLENAMDREARQAAVHAVTQSLTRLAQLSSSSSF